MPTAHPPSWWLRLWLPDVDWVIVGDDDACSCVLLWAGVTCLAAVTESGTINYYLCGRAATDRVVLEVGPLQKGFNGVVGIDGGAPDAMFTLPATRRGFPPPRKSEEMR